MKVGFKGVFIAHTCFPDVITSCQAVVVGLIPCCSMWIIRAFSDLFGKFLVPMILGKNCVILGKYTTILGKKLCNF